ncbi:tyrosine-type recombinase/integrase [Leucobacter sp. W1153]|uniref:tyrosine-type recombinase/integrase n=1 Tax=Leucobacter sp. W1153 TaxID=3439064 RepID=UPI003F386E08
MGSIRPYTNAKGETLYRIIFRDAEHKQTSKRGFTSQREAKLALGKIENAVHEGLYVGHKRGMILVSDLAPAWLATKKATLKPSSYAAIDTSWNVHVEKRWGSVPVAKIKREAIQVWANNLGRGPTTVRRANEVLAGILDTAIPTNIKTNPAREIALPKKKTAKARRYLTHQQLWSLAEASSSHQVQVLTLGYCGIRWGELTALQVRDLDHEKQLLTVNKNVVLIGSKLVPGTPKGGDSRRVPVPTRVWDLLVESTKKKSPEALIFPNEYGGFINPPSGGKSGRNWWVSALKKASIEYLPIHDLRHTAASLAVASGAHVKIIQRMLGHSSAAVTLDVYADLFEDDLHVLTSRLDSAIEASFVAKSVAKDPEQTKEKTPQAA